jgi:hypothetical protein
MPTYSPNIPLPGDLPSQSQDQILQNFQTLNTAFAQDHLAYNNPAQGQHKQITFPVGPVTGQPFSYLVGQIGLQNLNQAPTSVPDIWLTRGTAAAFPMTGFTVGGTNAGNGWTYLPSGILMAWGRSTTGAGSDHVTITYSAELTNFPGFTTAFAFPLLSRIGGIGGSTNFVVLTAYTQIDFQVYASAGGFGVQFAWMTIGI